MNILVESAAEANEELMDKYLEEESLTEESEIKQGIRQRTLANEIIPVLGGSAFKNKVVQAMLDAVIEYLPSPTEVKAIEGELKTVKKIPEKLRIMHPFQRSPLKLLQTLSSVL